MDGDLQKFSDDLKTLKRKVKAEANDRIAKTALRTEAERLGKEWFELQSKLDKTHQFDKSLLEKYAEAATNLIKLSAPNNRKSSYLSTLHTLTKRIRDDFILPLKANASSPQPSQFDEFVSHLSDPAEGLYFDEAINCARHGFLRAAAVMAWCSAIDRIHRKVEEIGFTAFNVASAHMASQQKGRFKKFNTALSVTSMSELREQPDGVIIWVIEGMQLIDSNQHTRLRSCFDMRNHSAHPGEAPITPYNLMSLFSDIDQIVLNNPKFALMPSPDHV